MSKCTAYYNCCNANDKELAGEAQFLASICPDFVMLPRLFEHEWRKSGGAGNGHTHWEVSQRRWAVVKIVREKLEVIQSML